MTILRIEELTPHKDILPKKISEFVKKNKTLHYQDIRLDLGEGIGAYSQDGMIKAAREDSGTAIGIRSYAKVNGIIATGYAGMQLGRKQIAKIDKTISKLQIISLKRAKFNAIEKRKSIKKFKNIARSLYSTKLADIKIYKETIKAKFKKNPRDLSLEELVKRNVSISSTLKNLSGIIANSSYSITGLERQIFSSSEGVLIDSAKPFTQFFIFVTARGKGTETFYEYNGAYAGLETFEEENPHKKTIEEFADFIAKGTVEVANAPAIKTTPKEVTVITDPTYNVLLSHEIMGHPSEADRALKRETAWAGRSWWFRSLKDNEFGKKIGSEQLTVFSDSSLKGYGNYKYDDEGVKAKKVYHIKNGILNEFLNSRETAAILGNEPNGGMRAASADNVPLIRMNNTCIDNGEWTKDEIFEETKDGYYAVGQKTPSIGETRQNFKITCWKLYKIENGELMQLYRTGGLTADSKNFFQSIDAVADDLKIYNVPNCGKGTPMQTMRVGNGGPHLRGKAIISGGHVVDSGQRDNIFQAMQDALTIAKQMSWWIRI